jgi:hypothetical protein
VRVRRWGLTKNLGGVGIDGRGGGRHGRENRVSGMEAPSIGSIPIRSAPQRCEKTTVDQLFQVVNDNCNSAVRRALLTWVQRFSPTLRQEFCRPGPPGAHTRKFTVSQNYFLIKDSQRPWITITRAYRAEKDGDNHTCMRSHIAQPVVFPDTTASAHGRRLRDHAGLP